MCIFAPRKRNKRKEMIEEQNIQVSITRIWQVLSHVRGVMPDEQLQQLAIALTFLRRIDCLIGEYAHESASFYSNNSKRLSDERLAENLCEISGGFPFYNYSGYTFNGILNANNSVEVVMNSYLQGFSKNVQEILDGMEFHQNLAVMMRQSRYLVEMFELFSEMDLSASTVDNEEFTELISALLIDSSRKMDSFCTPFELSNLLCECLLSVDVRNSKDENVTIYDPVCGTGSMLAVAGGKAKDIAVHQANISLFGQEISMYPSAVAKALVLLSGNDESKIMYGNTLTDDLFPAKHFQYILANPPLGLQWRPIKEKIEKESLDANGRFYIGLPSVNDSQFLFIEHILSKMDIHGSRAAFITTASVLWGGSASSGESRIRRWMFEKDLVETIIALPVGTLISTKIPVYLWILSNKKDEAQKGKVRLINTLLVDSKENSTLLSKAFVKSVVDEYKSKIVSKMSQIVKNEQFGYYEVGLLENGKKKETVNIPLDTDIEKFIEKERQPFARGKVTVDYSSVEKGYSVDFSKFFKSAENEVTPLEETTNSVLSVVEAIESVKPIVQQINNLEKAHSEDNSWTELPLRSATEVVFGINRPPVLAKEGLPILSVPYLRNPSGDEKYEVTPKTRCATENDVLVIVKGANTGEVFKGMNGILSPSMAAIKCTDESVITPRYMYYLLKGYEKPLMSMAKGVSIKSIDAKMIPDFKCLVPPTEEQIQISDYLDTVVGKIDKVIETLHSESSTFSTLRQALIENIVQGIWRIPNK